MMKSFRPLFQAGYVQHKRYERKLLLRFRYINSCVSHSSKHFYWRDNHMKDKNIFLVLRNTQHSTIKLFKKIRENNSRRFTL